MTQVFCSCTGVSVFPGCRYYHYFVLFVHHSFFLLRSVRGKMVEKYTVTANTAVMEDKCSVQAGWADSDGSVCEICFRVEFEFELKMLELCF